MVNDFEELKRIATSGTDMEKAVLVQEMLRRNPEMLQELDNKGWQRLNELLGLKVIIQDDSTADLYFYAFGKDKGIKVGTIPLMQPRRKRPKT